MALAGNLHLIQTSDLAAIADTVAAMGPAGLHVTNGIYAPPQEIVLNTTLAGFQYIADNRAGLHDIFMIAVNSDASVAAIKPGEPHEDQVTRALKVAQPLAVQHPDRPVVAAFFDAATPVELYETLHSVSLESIHKWGGYGAGKDKPVIEGAELFRESFAFPYLDPKAKPACYDETRRGDQTDHVEAVSLHHEIGRHGVPYLKGKENRALFAIRPF